jgi:hypothetical protein
MAITINSTTTEGCVTQFIFFLVIFRVGYFAREILEEDERQPIIIPRLKDKKIGVYKLWTEQKDELSGCLVLMFIGLGDLIYYFINLAFLTFYHYLFPVMIIFLIHHREAMAQFSNTPS